MIIKNNGVQNFKHIIMKNILTFYVFLFIQVTLIAQTYEPNWESLDSRPVPQWYQDAKFGVFIHWGVYSVSSWAYTVHDPNRKDWKFTIHYAEWYWRLTEDVAPFPEHHKTLYGEKFKYQDFAGQFKAEYFNPDQWAQILKNSGAKYVVLTSKHHDGFALWPSKQSWNWNSVDIGPHRDIVGELGTAVRKQGMHMGYYYSLYEWYNPTYRSDPAKYVDEHMLPQLKDLVSTYKPDLVWGDGEWEHPSKTWRSEEFLAWLYNESPVKNEVAVNDRWGKETRSLHGGYFTTEYGSVHDALPGEATMRKPFEECRGIGRSFGYNRVENLEDYLSGEALVHMLIDLVSKGGNLLLNIGPKADGTIPVIMQQRLAEIGDWLKINGDAIYGTNRANSIIKSNTEGIYFTQKGNTLYVICTKFPNKAIELEGTGLFKKISMLGFKDRVSFSQKSNKLVIEIPNINPANNPCDFAWVFKLE